jgi:hypothetical protein
MTQPPVKRTPATKPLTRSPVKLKIEEDPLTKMFESLLPPQQRLTGQGLQAVQPGLITQEQVQALQRTNLALWVAGSGIEVDHRPFDFDLHRYLIPMYLDRSKEIILMKSAQMGATIWTLLKLLHFCLHNDAKACFFFPTEDALNELSKDRMTPLIDSNQELKQAVQASDTLGYKKIGKKSALYLRHLGGVASKDSTPFDMIAFDEVRLLNAADISQARERISHSSFKLVLQVSTAGYPSADIHKQFLRGTQNYWHSKCNCPDGIILSEVFPDCIAISAKGEVYYRCPRCKVKISDPQNGRFVPHNPGAPVQSYHIHQMLSKFISPAEIWDAFQTTDNIKEFYNAKLGKPYVDEESRPVGDDDLMACENHDIQWQGKDEHTAMGVDQMSGNNYVVIAKRMPGGKKRIVHFEIIDNNNSIYWEADKRVTPFKRLYQLMKDYDVDLCIIDAMPNANEAMEFAREHPKRVFVSWYIEQQRETAQWGDRPKFKMTVRKGGPDIKFKHSVMLSRYLSIEMALRAVSERQFEWPHPRALVQIARNPTTGRFEPLHIFETHFYQHLKSIVRQKTVTNDETGQFKMEWINLGLDPHSVHALNYCNMALERLKRQSMFTFG